METHAFVRQSEGPEASNRRTMHLCYPTSFKRTPTMKFTIIHELAHCVQSPAAHVGWIGGDTQRDFDFVPLPDGNQMILPEGTDVYGKASVIALAEVAPDQAILVAKSYDICARICAQVFSF